MLFYIAIHYLKALAAHRKINIGETHAEIDQSVNPSRHATKMTITIGAWRQYKALYNYSRTARYEGITDFGSWNILKQADHAQCQIHLDNFRKYMESQGLSLACNKL